MIRLHIIAEGQTEKKFVDTVLTDYLSGFDVFCDTRCVLTSKDKRTGKKYSGGLSSYKKAKNDILLWIKQDKKTDCRFSTMFDFYALPGDFPGMDEIESITDPYEKVALLENALVRDIGDDRFIPYIQLHEFEALILSAVPDYDKVNIGPGIVSAIGIDKLCASCRHFYSWLEKLENLTIKIGKQQ